MLQPLAHHVALGLGERRSAPSLYLLSFDLRVGAVGAQPLA